MKAVDISDGLHQVISRMEAIEIPYMIVGSIAATIYGEPRLTRDLDLVLALQANMAANLLTIFEDKDFYTPPLAIIVQEITRCGQINILHHQSGLKVDLVFRRSNDHAIAEFSRRRRIEILKGLTSWVAAPEDVIIAKLRFYRDGGSEKHLVDIRGIIANTTIDRGYLEHWLQRLELEPQFAKV